MDAEKPKQARYNFDGHLDAAKACDKAGVRLTRFERKFLREIVEFNWPTPKQQETLAFICRKCGVKWER